MTAVRELFAKVSRESFFREIAPDLPIRGMPAGNPLDTDSARQSLLELGYFSAENIASNDECRQLARALDGLHAHQVPTPFLFVYDQAWILAERAVDYMRAMLGPDYFLMPDIWAWRIPREAGASGWKPHRGTYEDERRNGLPTVVNLWLALSDVTLDSACIHVLPIDKDPSFPDDLHSLDFDPKAAIALPVSSGTLLGWNSNVLHWSGAMTAGARTPRMSISFTVHTPRTEVDLEDPLALSFEARTDLVADMIEIYGENEGNDLDAAREWARMIKTMRAVRH